MIRLILVGAIIILVMVLLRKLFGPQPRDPFAPRPKALPKDGGTVAAEIEGQEIDIDPAVLAEVRKLAGRGEESEAVKHLRDATGLGLVEAARIVDSLNKIKK